MQSCRISFSTTRCRTGTCSGFVSRSSSCPSHSNKQTGIVSNNNEDEDDQERRTCKQRRSLSRRRLARSSTVCASSTPKTSRWQRPPPSSPRRDLVISRTPSSASCRRLRSCGGLWCLVHKAVSLVSRYPRMLSGTGIKHRRCCAWWEIAWRMRLDLSCCCF